MSIRALKATDIVGRSTSQAIWEQWYAQQVMSDMLHEVVDVFDDFVSINRSGTKGAADYLVDDSDANASVALQAAAGGVLQVSFGAGALDNEEAWVQFGGGEAAPFAFDYGRYLFFEAKFKVDTVADDKISVLIGLAEPKDVGDNVFQADNSGEVADIDFIGFATEHKNGGAGSNATLKAIHRKAGGLKTEAIASLATLTADTWYKVGFACVGDTIRYFLNGAEQVTTMNYSATTLPRGELLTPVIAAKIGSNGAANLYVDWVRAASMERGENL